MARLLYKITQKKNACSKIRPLFIRKVLAYVEYKSSIYLMP